MTDQVGNTVMIPADQLRSIVDELRKLREENERLISLQEGSTNQILAQPTPS